MRNNTNNGKNRWSTLPSSVKLAIGVMIGIGFLAFFHVANEKDEQTKSCTRSLRRNARNASRRPKPTRQITDEQRRMIRENSHRQAELDARAPELLEKYNREYYEDPDAEDHYPSEIFDDREDYDEEHVRDNPGVAGDD